MDEVFKAIKVLDYASGKYYMPARLLGNEVFCQVEDGPLPILVGYTRDTLTDRLSERKGEVRRHELEEDAAWVDPAYSAFFPNDVVGIVRNTLNCPGSATIAHWLSEYGPHSFYLKGLQKADVFADLNRPADEMYGLLLRIQRSLISLIVPARPDVASAFEHAAKVGGGSSGLFIGMQAGRSTQERATWWPPIKTVISDLAEANLLVDFDSAKVKVRGGSPVNLKDAYLTARVPISRNAKKKFGLAEAADALGSPTMPTKQRSSLGSRPGELGLSAIDGTRRVTIRSPVKRWINHPAIDYAVVAAVTLGAGFGRAQGIHPLEHLDGSGRLDRLQTMAGVSGVLLGLGVTAVTIVFTVTPGPRLRRALAEVGFGFVALLLSCLMMLAVCTAFFALAGPFYVGGSVTGVSFLVLIATTLVLLRTSRLMALLFLVLRTFAAEANEHTSSEAPPLVSGWTPPEISDDDYSMPTVPAPQTRRSGK